MVFSGHTGSADVLARRPQERPNVRPECPIRSGNPHMCTSNGNPTPKPNANLTATATVIKTEYWDRAGGGGNISYD